MPSRSRPVIVAVVFTLLALAGCSGGAGAGSGATSDSAALTAVGPKKAPGDEVCGRAAKPSGSRTIKHAMGQTEVPADPQRIVVLDSDKLDTVCALGLQDKLVGAIAVGTGEQPQYLGPTVHDVPTVGSIAEPALEKIAALKPDLILGSKFRTPDKYDELSKIAPTVFTESVGSTWKQNVLLDGKALRQGDRAKTLLTELTDRAEKVGQQVDGPTADVSLVRFIKAGIRIYGPDSFAGQVLADARISRPQFQQLNGAEDRRFTEISEEELQHADGKTIYVATYGQENVEAEQSALGSPLWKTLKGVKAERAFRVQDEVWMTGIGVIAAGRILDDLQESLAS
ncbi:ABC transporter substrate-binding protein [Microlunatus soli]|uniref:Iron complex transport system substrate-binding protein n=1 Tax=Microlunatus soli TaxID=630515 RepID=A0A1H1R6H3_9ACTN|nr:iron-siderophore ABC transporter substrate-binding protein [Microlunatus soli]SDS31260.1 iron complex transport system substrate-binding protein [Microlunatus soli]